MPNIAKGAAKTALPIDLPALERARLSHDPFPFVVVPRFVKAEALEAINADFPEISHAGSFPLPAVSYGPAFADLIDAIRGQEFTRAVETKMGIDLSTRPTMITVRGQSGTDDGRIHTDSKTKLVTVLIYMNPSWESAHGRLRLLRSASDLNDVVAEVPADEGALLAFRNQANAWHGFEPFEGPRRVIQLNWVRDSGVVWREQARHRLSAYFKRRQRGA
jgi:SM-20-related protein